MKGPVFTSGSVPFSIRGETFKTGYRTAGDIKSRRPLVCLHGGPGMPSSYMDPFGHLQAEYGIPVVLYDQFGCGESQPTDPEDITRMEKINPKNDIWSLELFTDELDNLLQHLGITDDFDLLGHSWGGVLASQYTIDRQPEGLKNLILANTGPTVHDWCESSIQLIESGVHNFPRLHRNVLIFAENHEDLDTKLTKEEIADLQSRGITIESPEYQAAVAQFMFSFTLRVQPWPESWSKALANVSHNPVNRIMWGSGWLKANGVLAQWSVKEHLHKIRARTLVYNGAYEQAQDFVVAPFVDSIPNNKWIKFSNSSHCPHYEEEERCMEVISEFLLKSN